MAKKAKKPVVVVRARTSAPEAHQPSKPKPKPGARVGLLDLPTEIQASIVEHLLDPIIGDEKHELRFIYNVDPLSRVNKHMHEVCRPYLWKKLNLDEQSTTSLAEAQPTVITRHGAFVQHLSLACGLDDCFRHCSVLSPNPPPCDPQPHDRVNLSAEIITCCSPRLRSLGLRLVSSKHGYICWGEGDEHSAMTQLIRQDVDALAAPLRKLSRAVYDAAALTKLDLWSSACTTLRKEWIAEIFGNKANLTEVVLSGVGSRDDDKTSLVIGRALASLPNLKSLHLFDVLFKDWSSLDWQSNLINLEISVLFADTSDDPTIMPTDLCNRFKTNLRWMRLKWINPPKTEELDHLPELEHLELSHVMRFTDIRPYRMAKKIVLDGISSGVLRTVYDAAKGGQLSRLEELVLCNVKEGSGRKVKKAARKIGQDLPMVGVKFTIVNVGRALSLDWTSSDEESQDFWPDLSEDSEDEV